jgi:hypothetical protein
VQHLRHSRIIKRSEQYEQAHTCVAGPDMRQRIENSDDSGEGHHYRKHQRNAQILQQQSNDGRESDSANGKRNIEKLVDKNLIRRRLYTLLGRNNPTEDGYAEHLSLPGMG